MGLVAIIDYGSGNLRSVQKSFVRAAHELNLDTKVVVTSDASVVKAAERIVLPGVGAFGACMRGLQAVPNMVETLEKQVLGAKRPFLGICVGMQLLASKGEEFEVTKGLGWVPGTVRKITPNDRSAKVPHMGWNTILHHREHDVVPDSHGLHAYFVHSFQVVPDNSACIVATTDHGGEICAIVAQDNIIGTQFHPEKSQKYGLDLIKNFLKWR